MIFGGKILQNTVCFTQLQTARVCAIVKRLSFLYFSPQTVQSTNHLFLCYNLKNKVN